MGIHTEKIFSINSEFNSELWAITSNCK